MAKNPSKTEIEKLVSFLPVFSKEGFDPILEWGGGELLPDGARTFPWPVYQETVEAFFRLASEECWCDYEYSNKNAAENIQDPNYIKNANLEQIKTLLTFCVRGERFCDGFWGSAIQSGNISRLLESLAEIAVE